MSSIPSRRKSKSAIDLIEEAVALLRSVQVSALVVYYAGAIPFWLALLYFVADMSQSAFAQERLIGGALGLTLLFIWMKCWHAVFASQLRGTLLLQTESRWTFSRAVRLISQQASIQPWGLILRPAALIVTVPFVWVAALFQNVTVLGDAPQQPEGRSLFPRAWQQAQLWPGQAHIVIGLLLLFGVFVWLNVMSFFFTLPWLLKTFFDVETEASRNMEVLLNSTVLTAAFALTMLFMDPIFKAVYVLRCFYGESLHTGQDLRMQLHRVQRTIIAVIIGASILFSPAVSLGAETPSSTASPAQSRPAVDSTELNRSIGEVLQRRTYAWRSSESGAQAAKGQPDSWANGVIKWISDVYTSCRAAFIKWLFSSRRKNNFSPTEGGSLPLQEIAYVALAASLAVGAWAFWKRTRQGSGTVAEVQALPPLPDLQSDDVAADQLPEDGWLDLMRKALAEGQRRLALRAAYLASLAHLGQRELLTITRYKSNREYSRELQRRARSRETLLVAFQENVEVFERAWYGDHEVSDTLLEQFTRNLETIRAC